jgi:hypothetical protein
MTKVRHIVTLADAEAQGAEDQKELMSVQTVRMQVNSAVSHQSK